MNKVLAIVLFLFAQMMSAEVTMATLKNVGVGRTTTTKRQTQAFQLKQQSQNIPVWMKGAYSQKGQAAQAQVSDKNKDQLANVTLKRNDALRGPVPSSKEKDVVQNNPVPAWMQAAQAVNDGLELYPQLASPGGIPAYLLNNYISPYLSQFLPNKKGNDQLSAGNPKKLNALSRVSGRTMFGEGVGPGTLDPSLWDMSAQPDASVFGSSYGGNWRGGGGGWQDWGSNNYPAWVKTLMGLNSWNIK